MSVINKVLRDLDKRQAAAPSVSSPADAALRNGTSGVEAPAPPPVRSVRPPAKSSWRMALAGGLLAVTALGLGIWKTGALDHLLPDMTDTASLPQTAPAPKPAAMAEAPPAAMPSVPDLSDVSDGPAAALAPASRLELTLALPKALQTDPAAAVLPAPAKAQKVEPPMGAPAAVATAPAIAAVAATSSAPAAVTAVVTPPPPTLPALTPADLAQKQQQAARDALAQAQSLWNSGSRDAALDLMQQAVASTERNATNAPSAGTTQTLVMLVREWGRMQLSEGRPTAVWETLTRLEPQLRNEPEMWALRANAAQRMDRHQDSVLAYMTALQSRPNEQRWLLGAAVSLAALGQVTSAADMAEKARAAGPITREVQTYLRQMGVPTKE